MRKKSYQTEIEEAKEVARKEYPDAKEVKVCRAYGGELIAEVKNPDRSWTLVYTGVWID